MMIKSIHISVACIRFYLQTFTNAIAQAQAPYRRSDSLLLVIIFFCCCSSITLSFWTIKIDLIYIAESAQECTVECVFWSQSAAAAAAKCVCCVVSCVYSPMCISFLVFTIKMVKKNQMAILVDVCTLCWIRFIFYAHSVYKTN